MRIAFLTVLLTMFVTSCGISPATRSTDRQADNIVEAARSQLGKRYKYGGEGPKRFDCSGLTRFVHSKAGISLDRRAADQWRQGQKVDRLKARPGDLVFFIQRGRIDHVGVVSKVSSTELWMIHSSSSQGVVEENMSRSTYWRKRYKGVRRVR